MRRRILAVASALAIVVLAAPGAAAVTTPPVTVSGPTPFAPNCNGGRPTGGTLYPNAEVEPWVSANPRSPANMVAVWQQDRWSDGGAQGNLTGVTFDAGRSWDVVESPPPFSRCAGGNAQNGGNYERATDPWVSFSPDGTAYQMALSIDVSTNPDPVNLLDVRDAMLVSKSEDGGRTWGKITTLIADDSPLRLNDKNSLTADPTAPPTAARPGSAHGPSSTRA